MHPISKRVVSLIVCLAVTGFFLYLEPVSSIGNHTQNLDQALSNIPGWQSKRPYELDISIIEALKLDDYVNKSFFRKGKAVSLYIGYYKSGKKVGAAHDPMVCFPGQGWVVGDKKKGKLEFNSQTYGPVSYSSMIAKKGDQKELILYWFQSYDVANSDTLSQKLNLIWKKLLHQGEDNAFVRITASIDNKHVNEHEADIIDFVKDFYPVFVDYIRQPYEVK